MHDNEDFRVRSETMIWADATDLAEWVRRREVSATALVRSALERIDRQDPAIHAVVEQRADAALAEAARIDRDGAGGPLCGVPITVKEAVHVAGMRSTWGLSAAAEHVASEDATVVARLRAAGAIVVGTTNVHEMLSDFGQTANSLYGRTRNPWDTGRTPGGSSGGAAAAVAAGLCCLDVGSDLVGSIRIPAAFCGVYGLKPSEGRVPLDGFRPPGAPQAPPESTYLSALGPIARSARDLRTALHVLTGRPQGRPRHERLADFRVGVVLDNPWLPTPDELRELLEEAIAAIAQAGAQIVPGWPAGVDPVQDFATFGRHLQAFFAASDPAGDGGDLGALRGEPARTAARAAWAQHFREVDVVACPVAPTVAFPHDDRPFAERTITTSSGEVPYERVPFWVAQASLSGLPAATVPVGLTKTGLPAGMQLIGPQDEDETVLTFAERLTDTIGGFQPPGIARTAGGPGS